MVVVYLARCGFVVCCVHSVGALVSVHALWPSDPKAETILFLKKLFLLCYT